MKKFLIILSVIFLCGCSNKNNLYSDFEHYNLVDKEPKKVYTFYNKQEKNTYVIADITLEKQDEGGIHGLFYNVDLDDYILLDEIELCGDSTPELATSDKYTYFYENKLYTLRCLGNSLIEYDLENHKFEKKELKFSYNESEDLDIKYIEKVDDNNIYYIATIHNNYNGELLVKCSLHNYICEKVK